MNALEATVDEEGLKEVWVLNLAGECVEGLEWAARSRFEDLIEEEEFTFSLKLEGRTRACSTYEKSDLDSLEERRLKFVF